MDFSFSEEQEALRAQARSFLGDRYPPERVAELADSPAGWDPDSWRELAELGWLGVSVAEDEGGTGLGLVEEAILLEELGRALYPGPYLGTVVALPFVDDRAEVAAGERRWSFALDTALVPDLGRVDSVLVVDAQGVRATPARGELLPSVDSTRPVGRLDPGATRALDAQPGAVRARVLAAVAAEAIGVAARALELAVEHARTREQFGRPVGVYQAVSHPLADTHVELELARSLAYWAAWSVDSGEAGAALAAAAAKAAATETAVAACERAIQAHGGIGFTWEHVLHRLYKRALGLEGVGGFPAAQRAEVAAALLDA